MNNTMILRCFLFFILIGANVKAQEHKSLNVSGGEASSESGSSASFSVGQLGYVSYGDSNMTISEGVQQSEFAEQSFSEPSEDRALKITVYPNPMIDYLIIDLPSFSTTSFSVVLYDIHGKLLMETQLNQQRTKITSEFLPKATYLLNVLKKGELAQTIKLIKG